VDVVLVLGVVDVLSLEGVVTEEVLRGGAVGMMVVRWGRRFKGSYEKGGGYRARQSGEKSWIQREVVNTMQKPWSSVGVQKEVLMAKNFFVGEKENWGKVVERQFSNVRHSLCQ